MKGFWKKLHRKTAVALVASMLATSMVPMTGLAAVYGVNGIYSEDLDFDLSEYLATASVAATVNGAGGIDLAGGVRSGETLLTAGYDIDVKKVSLASGSNATASNADWPETNVKIAEEILKHLGMTATVSDADPAIADFVYLNMDGLDSDSTVSAGVDVPEEAMQSLEEGAYQFTLRFAPELDEALGDNIVISSIVPCEFDITVAVDKGGSVPGDLKSTVELNGFHGEVSGETWIYVGDDPVDLNDYCVTDPEDLSVMFTSSDPEVATISDAGIFTPLANGKTTVKAKVTAEGYEQSTDKMKVQVWTYEPMPSVPDAFELYEGEAWQHTFEQSLAKDVCVLDKNGETAGEEIAEVKLAEKGKKITVTAKKAGSYQLKLVQHADGQVTYIGYVDFTVKPARDAVFHIDGFHGETDDPEGVTSTWTYMEHGRMYLDDYCHTDVEGATITFTSSDESVAVIEDGYLIPLNTGRTTITATMEAPGYRIAADTLHVDVWKFEPQHNLPESITVNEGKTWSYTFPEPLKNRTYIKVYSDDTGEEVGEDVINVSLSEDRTVITVEAKQAGEYYLVTERHMEERYTTYTEEMYISVLKEGVSLSASVNQIVVEPGETVTFDVAYTPGTARLEFEYFEEYIEVAYENGKVTVTGLMKTEDVLEQLVIRLVNEDEVLAAHWIQVVVAEKQLEAATVEEALAEANQKIGEAIEYGNYPEIIKLVDEVVTILKEAPQSEIADNLAAIDELENELSKVAAVGEDVYGDNIRAAASGALLNLISMGEFEGKLIVKQIEDTTNTTGVTLDIKFQRGSDGETITELAVPMQLKLKVPEIDLTKKIRIKHTKEDGSVAWIYPTVEGEYLVFWVDSYSTFAISNVTSGGSHSGGSGGGGGGGSSVSASVSGTVTSDAKKGYVNSVSGIITGSAAGYSQWNQDAAGWKLQYADGTFAAGAMLADENGNPYEQVAWELINGAWYPFGADGYVKGGLVYDAALGGMFYVDINTGMKTGWQLVDGVWRYFNTVSDGKRGIMLTDTTVDGYYIDADGIWRQ